MARTLSATAHSKVLAATAELIADRGIDRTSMDTIAGHAGVSKATIYNHWTDKEALLVEMVLHLHGACERPNFDTGDTRADMKAVLAYRPKSESTLRERIMPQLLAYSATRPSFGLVWRKSVMEQPRRELTHLLQLGIQKGELTPTLDIELSLALLLGPIMYWFAFLRRDQEDPTELAAKVVDSFWLAYQLPPKTPPGTALKAPVKSPHSVKCASTPNKSI